MQRLISKTLRRTFATLAHYQTMVDVLTQAQLGHASPVQSMAYIDHPKAHREEHGRRRSETVNGDVLWSLNASWWMGCTDPSASNHAAWAEFGTANCK